MSDERFRKVSVLLTDREYQALFSEACFTGPGTVSAAIRERLGWYATPYGYVKWAKEQERVSRESLP